MVFKDERHDSMTSSSNALQQVALAVPEAKTDLVLHGELAISDYVGDVPASSQTIKDIENWSRTRREVTRTNLAMWLVKLFSVTLVGTGIVSAMAVFTPSADKALLKEVFPLLITPQATLLGVALTFYFTSKEER